MTKNIVIGIGGTGLSAIRELRRLCAEGYDLGLQDPSILSTRFVYIDTDGGDAGRRSWQVLGKDISLKPAEIAVVTGDQLRPIVQNPAEYPAYRDWLPSILDYVGDPGEGAKGIRPYGRLIYEYGPNKARIHETILNAFNGLNQQFPQITAWRYYVICSLSGGTGSGMFLPLANDLAGWSFFKPGTAAEKVRSFLVLPPLQISKRHDRYHANAFAALKELNYHGAKGSLPFSNTYLLEPVNAAGNNIGVDNLPLLIAQRLFLNIQGGGAAARIDSLMDNPNLGGVANVDSKRAHALCFSSFGLSSLSYPRETMARCVALRWAVTMLGGWLEERDAPKNMNEVARNDLARLRLSTAHIHGDADPFGTQDYPLYEKAIPQAVDNRIDPLEKRQLGANANKVREELEEGFRGKGITAFYQQREQDAARAAEGALRHIQLQLSRQVRERDQGIRFAKQYLDELIQILETEAKVEAAGRCSPGAQNQIAVFQRNYSDSVNTVSLHEEQFFYRDSEFARDKANLGEDLKGYLLRVAGYAAGKYAMKLLDALIPLVKTLRASMDVWQAKLIEVFQKLDGKLLVALEGKSLDAKENGRTVFDDMVLAKVAAQGAATVVNPAIEARLRELLTAALQKQMEELNLFSLMEQSDPEEMVERAAFEYVLSADSPLQIGKATLYDHFLTDYPKPEERRRIFHETQGLAEVFTRWSPAEVARQPVPDVPAFVVSIPEDANNQKAQATVRSDLTEAGVGVSDIQATQDLERILFIRERLAFPVRFIDSVKRLKEYYDRFPAKDALHIDKREQSLLFDVFLQSEEERRQTEEAEEAFVLARANEWLRRETNQQTLAQEVRYEYQLPGKIGVRVASLGPDWDAAFERFTQGGDAVHQEARVLLIERARAARQQWRTNGEEWRNQFAVLDRFLSQSLAGYRARSDDPRYRRDLEIIQRIQTAQESMASGHSA